MCGISLGLLNQFFIYRDKLNSIVSHKKSNNVIINFLIQFLSELCDTGLMKIYVIYCENLCELLTSTTIYISDIFIIFL